MEKEGLTFKPQILSKGSGSKAADKFEQLYQHGLNKHARKTEDRPLDEIELERDPDAFTFKPEIHEINYTGSAKPILSGTLGKHLKPEERDEEAPENVRPTFEPEEPKSVEKRTGKRARETVGPETTQSRGNPSQQNPSDYTGNNYLDDMDNNSMFNASQSVIDTARQAEEQHLNIDIEIGQKKHRITLFRDSDCTQISKDFAATHKLPREMQAQLERQLKENMSYFD